MANRQRGEVAITVGDRTYTLRLTMAAMVNLEDVCSTADRPLIFPEILERVTRGSVKYLRLFVWACLQDQHSGMTLEDAGRLVDDAGGFIAFGSQLNRIAESLRPDAEDEASPQKTQEKTPPGTGAGSTSTPAPSA